MAIGTLLVLLGFILALVACFAGSVGRLGNVPLVAVAVALVSLGVLFGAGALIHT